MSAKYGILIFREASTGLPEKHWKLYIIATKQRALLRAVRSLCENGDAVRSLREIAVTNDTKLNLKKHSRSKFRGGARLLRPPLDPPLLYKQHL